MLNQLSLLIVLSASLAGLDRSSAQDQPANFSRDVLPLLSENCFKCHGPDEPNRQAGLRLDKQEGAVSKVESGETGVVPGKSADSAIFKRITSADPDLRMPPPDSGKSLSAAEIANIKHLIDRGGKWTGH